MILAKLTFVHMNLPREWQNVNNHRCKPVERSSPEIKTLKGFNNLIHLHNQMKIGILKKITPCSAPSELKIISDS